MGRKRETSQQVPSKAECALRERADGGSTRAPSLHISRGWRMEPRAHQEDNGPQTAGLRALGRTSWVKQQDQSERGTEQSKGRRWGNGEVGHATTLGRSGKGKEDGGGRKV